ncbi:MAG: glucose 1-dehydrogenase [Candidatus Thermoplasmatota archaeon]|jgi:NAD(P)-dependent dehydrogenase (short-subunit alcohol dehydrogenase family)|nr:glucose 1-dehydrogenase [Candidatus Thermoplasmatota archaeon]MCL5988816.1 glucose 1-dehydrogenase [Candidatus Thermoplasmatota archaeon]
MVEENANKVPGVRVGIDLRGKVALVTGSSSGLGMEIAKYLAKAGATVAIHYHSEKQQADQVAANIVGNGGKAVVFGGDVSNKSEVESIFNSIDEELGSIDILVNNAGIDGKRELCGDDNTEDWEKVIAINLMGPYYCAREAVKRMKKSGHGVIINITSVHEYLPWSGYTAYCSAKAGLSMFTKTLAQEVSDFGIRVVAVAPGAIKTPINKAVWGNPDTYKDLLEKIAMPRMGEPIDIAEAVTFLASDMASYITGTTLVVDGGMLLYPAFKHGG